MTLKQLCLFPIVTILFTGLAVNSFSQDGPPPDQQGPGGFGGPGGPGGFGGGRGPGGPMNQQVTKLVEKFDANKDGYLNLEERKAAREYLKKEQASGGGQRGFGGRGGGPGGNRQAANAPTAGKKISPAEVKSFNTPLYDGKTLRTFFLDFESPDWEKELSEFHNTDVEVPATLTVDGKVYKNVGVHFRGMSSYFMVGEGSKRSLNVTLDLVDSKQAVGGYRTLNLLNAHEDPTFLRPVLFYDIARQYMPSPKANFARVVINGENWGIYNNVEQFNKDFVKEWYGTTKGARFKVRGSPNGQGSLKYLGDDPKAYKGIYSLKSKEDATVWPSFIKMTKVLNETPPDKLVEALSPLLDIDGALRFIALDNALINNDGYWIRTSDYSIYQDVKGQFHVIAQDANETFVKPGGPGFGGGGGRGGPGGRQGGPGGPGGQGQAGGPGGPNGQGGPGAPGQPQLANGPGGPGQQGGPGGPGGPGRGFGGGGRGNNMPAIKGIDLDPLLAVNDPNKPLVSKLLAVPALKAKYLGYVKDIADKKLDWNYLGPIATGYHNLIDEGVKEDTRKLETTEDFDKSLIEDIKGNGGGPGGSMGIKSFADQRRAYLLNYTEKKKEATEEKK